MYTCLSEPQVAAYLERIGYCGEWNGVRYTLVSCDALSFRLQEVPLA